MEEAQDDQDIAAVSKATTQRVAILADKAKAQDAALGSHDARAMRKTYARQ